MPTSTTKENSEQNGTPELSGVNSILKERGSTYGDSGINFGCISDLQVAFQRGQSSDADQQYGVTKAMPDYNAHNVAIQMVLVKLGRIATGIPHQDNYDDAINYLKLARKHAIEGST